MPVCNLPDDPSLENLEARWVFQLLAERHRLLDMMSLPPGFVVVWDGDVIEAVLDPDDNNLWDPTRDE